MVQVADCLEHDCGLQAPVPGDLQAAHGTAVKPSCILLCCRAQQRFKVGATGLQLARCQATVGVMNCRSCNWTSETESPSKGTPCDAVDNPVNPPHILIKLPTISHLSKPLSEHHAVLGSDTGLQPGDSLH